MRERGGEAREAASGQGDLFWRRSRLANELFVLEQRDPLAEVNDPDRVEKREGAEEHER